MTAQTRATAHEMPRLLSLLARHRYTVVTSAFLLCALAGDRDEGDLEFFWIAEHELFHGAGLGIYRARPDIQIGPLAVVLGSVLSAVTGRYLVLASIVVALALLLLTIRSLDGLIVDAGWDPVLPRLVLTFGGTALASSWATVVPGWGHLDDLGALLALVAALRATRRGGGVAAGLLLAVAVDCKPWAVFAVGMLLLLPNPAQTRRAVGALIAVLAVCWLPFLLGAPGTIEAVSRFRISANVFSLPYALGFHQQDPGWIRPAQLILSTVLVLACIRFRRWDLALLVVAVARLLLDGGVFPYYDAELVLGALVADLAAAAGRHSMLAAFSPLALLAWGGMEAVHQMPGPGSALSLRCGLYVVLLAVGVLRGPRAAAGPDGPVPTMAQPTPLNSGLLVADI